MRARVRVSVYVRPVYAVRVKHMHRLRPMIIDRILPHSKSVATPLYTTQNFTDNAANSNRGYRLLFH